MRSRFKKIDVFCFLKFVVDVVEIGESQRKIGDILKVKPLAALAMIDEGELDWKIVAISLDDPRASLVNDVDDVEKHFPVFLSILSGVLYYGFSL